MSSLLYISMFRRARLNAISSNIGIAPTGGRLGVLTFVDAFFENVERDGGTYENAECVARSMKQLGSATYTDAFRLFKNRMTDDGGTFDNPCFDQLMYTITQ